jgi:hypothetical protein
VYNGADDNGSGTCGMLALAGRLATHGPMRRSVMLMGLGRGEGVVGLESLTEHPGCRAGASLCATSTST